MDRKIRNAKYLSILKIGHVILSEAPRLPYFSPEKHHLKEKLFAIIMVTSSNKTK